MSAIPVPEPTESDERLALAFIEIKDATNLRGRPEQVNGDRQACDNCHFYADPDKPVAYCWHPKLQVGVGFDHWCSWWEPIPDQE